MKTLNISDARNTLPALVESVSATRVPVMLLRYGKPAAMLVPVVDQATQANPYPLRGLAISASTDFDAPLSDLWEACDVAEDTEVYQAKTKGQAKARRKGKTS